MAYKLHYDVYMHALAYYHNRAGPPSLRALLQPQESVNLVVKVDGSHGRLAVAAAHAGAEVRDEATLLLKVGELLLVLATNIVT